MRYTHLLSAALVTLCIISGSPVRAQQNGPIQIEGGSLAGKEMIFIAETHSIREKAAFYHTFIPWLAGQHGIHNLVLETSRSVAYLINRYLYNEDTTILLYNTDSTARKRLQDLREANSHLPADRKVRVYGMDFERMEFAVAAKKILEANGAQATALYRYVNALLDSVLYKTTMTPRQSKMRITTYGQARDIFATEKETLKAAVKTDYDVLEGIFENPALEKKFSRRDRGMHRNISSQLQGQPFLCIVGRYHTEYTRHQVYPSLIKLLTKGKPANRKKLVIIDEVSNLKYLTTPLWSPEGTPQTYTTGKAGPEYFTKNDSAMARAYNLYLSTDKYVLVHKDAFSDIVHKDNHGLNSYYIFFGKK